MDDHAAMLCPFGEVAMAPDIVEALEIGRAIFRAVGVVPEADGHCREGLGADQFALFAENRFSIVVPDIHGKAEARPLDLALPDRLDRIAEHKTGADVGAAGDGGELDVRLY